MKLIEEEREKRERKVNRTEREIFEDSIFVSFFFFSEERERNGNAYIYIFVRERERESTGHLTHLLQVRWR